VLLQKENSRIERNDYNKMITSFLEQAFEIAEQARAKRLDPLDRPEPKIASDLAERVEELVGPKGVAQRIRELGEQMGSREEVAFKIVEEIVFGRFGHMEEEVGAEQAVRTALAILTEGITAAPLQGISNVTTKNNLDGSKYLAVYFAGPIRSAGGTEQALILVVADFVRRLLGLDRYKPTVEEVNRFVEEVRLYEREVVRFQYHVPDESLSTGFSNLPVEATGTWTDRVEVSSYRNLPRIETNRVRAGALRVVNDGIVGRSEKVWKIIEGLGIIGWEWLEDIKVQEESGLEDQIESMYMRDVIAGRPIFSFPSRVGGFRLRYGRSRNTGLAAVGIHPATMTVLHDFLAIGTQIRMEKPGKGAVVLPVDSIEPPVVRLRNGNVVRIDTVDLAEEYSNQIEKILFLGDILVAFGEFVENNKELIPSGFTEEWWAKKLQLSLEPQASSSIKELSKHLNKPISRIKDLLSAPLILKPSFEEATLISQISRVPLHPSYTFFWENISRDELIFLRQTVLRKKKKSGKNIPLESIKLPDNPRIKEILEKLCVPHTYENKSISIEKVPAQILYFSLLSNRRRIPSKGNVLEVLSHISGVEILEKGGTYIGARMGRPEKAKRREMSPLVHVLFPVGLSGGPQRNLVEAAKKEVIEVDIVRRRCLECNTTTYENLCPNCGGDTKLDKICQNCGHETNDADTCPSCGTHSISYQRQSIPLNRLLREASRNIKINIPSLVKGVKGLTSENKIPEPIEKGILRAKYDLSVFKDGTIRFDATNAPLTHFKPSEIGGHSSRLRELGYYWDQHGAPLTDDNQICEIKSQDLVIPLSATEYLVNTARYLDELLVRFYGLTPYYNVNEAQDLLGHLVVGLAPHTSVGVIGRIVGFSRSNVIYAHPLWHAAKRRDCDGDEDAVMLLLDPLLNFSELYLPVQIGSKMDIPLLITPVINAREVDDEAHNMDIVSSYPIVMYEGSHKKADSKNLSMVVDTIGSRLGTESEDQGYSYTHYTSNVGAGNSKSAYKRLDTMNKKMKSQLALAEKIVAVDAREVARRVLTSHLIRDIVGNLKAFSTQSFRCRKCNMKYRRVPILGKCTRCGGQISLTVYRGGVEKYLLPASTIAKKYKLDDYYLQRLTLVEDEINSLFGTSKSTQVSLGDFL
jgi:DNA polymerase II large subunit